MYRVTIRQSWDGPEMMIHSPHANPLKLINVTVTLDVAAISAMAFDIFPGNPGYEGMNYMTTLVRVTDTINNMDVFEGRILSPSEPIESSGLTYKAITCEGLLSWLRDSRPGFLDFENKTRKEIFSALVDAHNGQMTLLGAPYKCFKLGNVDMADTVVSYCYTDDTATSYENISSLVLAAGYELAVRHESDGLYIDCAKTIGGTGDQVIRLGSNVISFTRVTNPSSVVSALMPLGKAADPPTTENTTTDKGTARLTISSANNGSPLLIDADRLKQFGPIVGTNSWDDETDATKLKPEGDAYFKTLPVATISTQVQAIDLSFVGKSKSPLLCGWKYRTMIPLKGIDEQIRITQMTLDINDPRNNVMTIGDRVIGQEEYNAELLKGIQGMSLIKSTVQRQTKRINTINKSVNTAVADALAAKTAVDDAQKALSKYDFAGMQNSLNTISDKVGKLPENIADIGNDYAALQNAVDNEIKPDLAIVQKQIIALNDKVGITSAEGSEKANG